MTRDKELTGEHQTFTYAIAGNTLSIDGWISLKKEEADIRRAFPDEILEKHFQCRFVH